MSAATQGSEEGCVGAETSDCSAHMEHETAVKNVETAVETEKSTEVATRSSGELTDEELLGHNEDDCDKGDVSSNSSTNTIVPETLSDIDSDFSPDLLTRFAGNDQTPLAKAGFVEGTKPAKIVPVKATKESPEVEMVSKPLEVKDDKIIEKPVISGGGEEFSLKDKQFVNAPYRITMVMKRDFRDHNHQKSGRYYLQERPLVTNEGRKCGLLIGLRMMVTFKPCGASYQQCYSVVPMVRLMSSGIDHLKPLKIVYWDNSSLYINEGKPIGVKIPTEVSVEWLDSHIDAEKDLVERSKSLDLEMDWGIITVSNPTQFANVNLFFAGHHDSDTIKEVEILPEQVTDKLIESFMRLGSQSTVASFGSNQKPEEKPATASKDGDAGPGVATSDDLEKGMTNNVLDSLHLDSRGAKDC